MTTSQFLSEQEFLSKLEASMSELEGEHATFKGMIYGTFGSGKTIEAVHLAQIITPPDKTILLIDSAEGWVSLENHPALKRRVIRQAIPNISALEVIGNAIADPKSAYSNVGCVIIDEASSYSSYDQLMVARGRAQRETGNAKNEDEIKLPDMGISANRFKKFLAPMARNKDCHLILVAHERIDKDNNAVTVTSPAFLPTLFSHLAGLMHVIGHLDTIEQDVEGKRVYSRTIQVMPTRRIVAKSRVKFDSILVEPKEFNRIVKEWLNGTVAEEPYGKMPIQPEPIMEEVTTGQEAIEIAGAINDLGTILSEITGG